MKTQATTIEVPTVAATASLPAEGLLKTLLGRIRLEKRHAIELVWYAGFVSVVLLLQSLGGAYQSEFGGHADEAAHYVTGLMVHDYLKQGGLSDPYQFATRYYVHYPKVAIGHWPPLFYVVEAGWMLVFGESRVSVLVLMACITGLIAYTVFHVTRVEFGTLMGALIGLLLIAFPVIQRSSSMVMSDNLLSLLVLWSVLCFGKYLNNPHWRLSLGFGVLASLAILTKSGACSLALMVPFAVLFTGRWRVWGRWDFWLPAAVVLVLCAPWYIATMRMASQGLYTTPGDPAFAVPALKFLSSGIWGVGGTTVFVIVAAGIAAAGRRLGGYSGLRAAAVAQIISVLLFHSIVPAGLEPRYLIPSIPPFVLIVAYSLSWLAKEHGRTTYRMKGLAVLLLPLMMIGFVIETFTVPAKACGGFRPIVEQLVQEPELDRSVLLIASDVLGEGMFVAEAAMGEPRPGHVILRASKVLASSDWNGENYRPIFHSAQELVARLESIPVGVLVIDTSAFEGARPIHQQQLLEMIDSHPQTWQLTGTFPVRRWGSFYDNAVRIYRQVGHESQPPRRIVIDMTESLGKTIYYDPVSGHLSSASGG